MTNVLVRAMRGARLAGALALALAAAACANTANTTAAIGSAHCAEHLRLRVTAWAPPHSGEPGIQ